MKHKKVQLIIKNHTKASDIDRIECLVHPTHPSYTLHFKDSIQAPQTFIQPLHTLRQTLSERAFSHSIFDETLQLKEANHYVFEYEHANQIYWSLRKLIASFFQSDFSQTQLHVKAAAGYTAPVTFTPIYYSSHPTLKARVKRPVQRIETITNTWRQLFFGTHHLDPLTQDPFRYQSTPYVNLILSYKDLKGSIDADALYQAHPLVETLLDETSLAQSIELRYINDSVGMGVFARQTIENNTPLMLYSGEWVRADSREDSLNYTMYSSQAALKLDTDASGIGNIASFVNHAPAPNSIPSLLKNRTRHNKVATRNLKTEVILHCGIAQVVYRTTCCIKPGEQLLIDYGSQYWPTGALAYFTHAHKLLTPLGKRILKDPQHHRHMLLAMAHSGLPCAWIQLLYKPIAIVLFLMLATHW